MLMIGLSIGCASPDSSESGEDQKAEAPPILNKSDMPLAELTTTDFSDSVVTISVSYAAITCSCPQWFETKFSDVEFLDGVERFYLEPASKDLINANTLWDGEHLPFTVKITGRFSRQKVIPSAYPAKGMPEKARVFRYEKITVLSILHN